MDGHRHKSSRRRRRSKSRAEPRAAAAPVMIVARRPDSPSMVRSHGRLFAASAAPARGVVFHAAEAVEPARASREEAPEERAERSEEPPRRTARIVQLPSGRTDEREEQRRKLLRRLMQSEGRGAISRAADEYLAAGFELPDDQEVHLQLLEHFNEDRARESLEAMTRLLNGEAPLKKPVLDQRLRRLEEHAEEPQTRDLAATLRRSLRG